MSLKKNYYEILGLSITATVDEIKKKYKRLILKCHPDKGGDTDEFQKIQKAYNVLRDDTKKKAYDMRLKTTLERNKHFSDISDSSEESSHSSTEEQHPVKVYEKSEAKLGKKVRIVPDIYKCLNITLQDIYTHKVFKLNIERLRCCDICRGKGFKNFVERVCIVCGGDGVYNSFSPISRWCEHCWGSGKVKVQSDPHECGQCRGRGVLRDVKTIQISAFHCVYHSIHGNPKLKPRIIFRDEGNHIPFRNPGNIIIELNEIEEEDVKRDKLDLIYTKYITLYDAIFGSEFEVKHPSGENIKLNIKRMLDNDGMLSEDWFKQRVKNFGLPSMNVHENGNSIVGGDLVVNFKIIVPEIKSKEDQEYMKNVFLSSNQNTFSKNCVEKNLEIN